MTPDLIKCPACGKDVYKEAKACPSCGCPKAKWEKKSTGDFFIGKLNTFECTIIVIAFIPIIAYLMWLMFFAK